MRISYLVSDLSTYHCTVMCVHALTFPVNLALGRQIAPVPFAPMLSALEGMLANWLKPISAANYH